MRESYWISPATKAFLEWNICWYVCLKGCSARRRLPGVAHTPLLRYHTFILFIAAQSHKIIHNTIHIFDVSNINGVSKPRFPWKVIIKIVSAPLHNPPALCCSFDFFALTWNKNGGFYAETYFYASLCIDDNINIQSCIIIIDIKGIKNCFCHLFYGIFLLLHSFKLDDRIFHRFLAKGEVESIKEFIRLWIWNVFLVCDSMIIQFLQTQ